MKKLLNRMICLIIGHRITEHRMYETWGAYYCPRCDRRFEYYEDPYSGHIVEHEITKD